MGQNSTEVAYGFGQMGSVFTNLDKPVYPPKGHVIVAIQFLADNTLDLLHTETLDTMGPQYITIEDDELEGAGGPDANYAGVTEAACTGALTTVNFTNDTVTIGATNDRIKAGHYVLLVNDADTIDAGITVDTETPTPIYNGKNQAGVKVVSVNRDNITLDEFHGAGGTTLEGVTFPKGITIVGRWTMATLGTADADGGMICYFGQ